MSTSGAGGPRVQRLFDRAASANSIGEVIFTGIGAVLLAAGSAVASGILSLADVVIVPLNAITNAVGQLIDAVFGGSAFIIDLGAIASGRSIGPGGLFASPLSFIFGIAIVLGALYVVRAYVSEEPTSNFFPGLPFDIPTPLLTDAEEDDKDS